MGDRLNRLVAATVFVLGPAVAGAMRMISVWWEPRYGTVSWIGLAFVGALMGVVLGIFAAVVADLAWQFGLWVWWGDPGPVDQGKGKNHERH